MNNQLTFRGTPGPWQYEGGDNHSIEVSIGDTTASIDRCDKNTGNYMIEREEMESNGRLIAAAPDLLSVVEEFIHWAQVGGIKHPLVHDAKSAVEKALK